MAASRGVAKWELWLAAGSLFFIVAAQFVGLLMQINTQSGDIQTLKSERVELTTKDNLLNNQVSDLSGQIKTLQGQIAQIQGQVCTLDITRNLMHAYDMRELSMLFQKVFGQSLPTDNSYYPTICMLPTEPR